MSLINNFSFISSECTNLDKNLKSFTAINNNDYYFYLDLNDNKIKFETKSHSFFHKLDRIYNTFTGNREYKLCNIAQHLIKNPNFFESHFKNEGFNKLIELIVKPLKLTPTQKNIALQILKTGEINNIKVSKDYLKVQELLLKQPNLLKLHQESSIKHQAATSKKLVDSFHTDDLPPSYPDENRFETDKYYYYLDLKNNNELKLEEKNPSFINKAKRFFYVISGKRDYSLSNIAIAIIKDSNSKYNLPNLIDKIVTKINISTNSKQFLMNYLTFGFPKTTSIDKHLFLATKLLISNQELTSIYEKRLECPIPNKKPKVSSF